MESVRIDYGGFRARIVPFFLVPTMTEIYYDNADYEEGQWRIIISEFRVFRWFVVSNCKLDNGLTSAKCGAMLLGSKILPVIPSLLQIARP